MKIELETKSPCNPENLSKKVEGKKMVLLGVNMEPEWVCIRPAMTEPEKTVA